MSFEITARVRKSGRQPGNRLLASRKFVLFILADNANQAGLCFPSVSHLAESTNLDEKTVRDCLKDLEASGHITVIKRRQGRSSVYLVHPDGEPVTTPGQAPGVVEGSPRETPGDENAAVADVPALASGEAPGSEGGAQPEAHDRGDTRSPVRPTPGEGPGVDLSTSCGLDIHTPGEGPGTPGASPGTPRAPDPVPRAPDPAESSLNPKREPSRNLGAPDGKNNPQERRRNAAGGQVLKPPPAQDADVERMQPEEAERLKAEQLERIRAKGVAV